jgi:hypothetical protein
MLPPVERRPRNSMEYRNEERRSSIERSYGRIEPVKLESPGLSKPIKTPPHSTIEAKLKDITDPGREPLNGTRSRPPLADIKPETSSPYGYPPPERYRDAGDYGVPPYPPFEGRGRDPDPRGEPYDKRDPRDPYYSSPSYPAVPPSEYRGKDAYPPRAQPPLDYARGPAYDERYPRGPMDLDSQRGREGYRDLPPRSFEYDVGAKRKLDTPDYRDPYDDPYKVYPCNSLT